MKMQIVSVLVEVGGELAQRLRHEASLSADVVIAHVAFDLGLWCECRNRVDDDDVERTGTDEHVAYFEGLFTRVGLGDQQAVDIDADRFGVDGIHGVFGVDVGARTTVTLCLGNNVGGQC